jgi:GNAT superfamily N-acetyltransferase
LFVETLRSNPKILPDAYFVAVHDGEYVGQSVLWANRADAGLDTGLTGVRRAYRRRGVALALKLRGIDYARRHGHPLIRTGNDSHNLPMLSINERLGFVKQPAWILLSRGIEGG